MQTNLAESLPQVEQPDLGRPQLYIVPDTDSQVQTSEIFISADAIPELAFRRQRAAQEAQKILAHNSQLLHNGRDNEVPAASDPLGSQRRIWRR